MGLVAVFLAVLGFVGSHLLLSHQLRGQAISVFGRKGFQTAYSLISIGFMLAILAAYHFAPHGPTLWSPDNVALQAVFSVVGYFAVALFLASLFGNPGLVGANLNGLSTRQADGVFRITRHPMMFAIVIWCVVQVMIMPSARNAIVCGGLIPLALIGARLQDARKSAQSGREWSLWVTRTPFWPDLRRIADLGMFWGVAVIPWLVVTWLEVQATMVPVGLWYFFPSLPY